MIFVRPEVTADIASGAVPAHKSESLYDGHQGEDHSGRAACTCAEAADEKCVGHIIYIGYKHTYYRRDSKPYDKRIYRRICHHAVLFRSGISFHFIFFHWDYDQVQQNILYHKKACRTKDKKGHPGLGDDPFIVLRMYEMIIFCCPHNSCL